VSGAFDLVGDLGGTRIRLALARPGAEGRELVSPWSGLCGDYESPEAAIGAYLAEARPASPPRRVVLAVAGPVEGGAVAFTNSGWRVSEAGLRAAGFAAARLINDFAAVALAAPGLGEADLRRIGEAPPAPHEDVGLVVGPGTGFGVAGFVRVEGRWRALPGEGGHVGFAPADVVEVAVLERLVARFGRVSVERLLSGPGLAHLHVALAEIEGRTREPLTPAEITSRASAGDARCAATVERFGAILGSVAGDLALAFGARAGVFVGGGVTLTVADALASGPFRARFEAKGRLRGYMAAIPTALIVQPLAPLHGAAAALDDL